ncbi:MAG: UDP binding domain-containing protein [Rhizomicrobium sp.]
MQSGFAIPVVACYGIAYKPNVDDVRESPSVEIVERLAERGDLKVLVVEPNVSELPRALREHLNVHLVTADEAQRAADIVALLVSHKQFQRMDRRRLLGKVIVDAIGLMN